MATITQIVNRLEADVETLRQRITGFLATPLIFSALGETILYGCKVTEGVDDADMTIALEGQATGDENNHNPLYSASPLRTYEYANIASLKDGAFTSQNQTATVQAAPATGLGRFDIAYIYQGTNGSTFAVAAGTPSAGAKTEFDTNGVSTAAYGGEYDPALPLGALPVARIYVEDVYTGVANARIADLRSFFGKFQVIADGVESVEVSVTAAEEWANNDEDVLVSAESGGDEIDDYSAKHFSIKASNSATASEVSRLASEDAESSASASAANAGTSETNAINAQSYAEEWANKPEDSLVSSAAGGNETTEYSARHHAAKALASEANAADSQSHAAEWAVRPEDSLIPVAAGGNGTTDYSSYHWAQKAADSAATIGNEVIYAAEWANKAEDVLVSPAAGGDNVDDYSAYHWAQKAQAAAASLTDAVSLQGTWDASSGSFPEGGTAQTGYSYIVSVAGTVDGVEFNVNDRIVAIVDNASTTTYAGNWHHLDYTDRVLSVAGKTGAVTIESADITSVTQNRIIGRISAGPGAAEQLTAANIRTIINVEDGATADQSNAEIEAAYNAQVEVVSQVEAEAGVATTPRRWTAERVGQAITALSNGSIKFTAQSDGAIEAGDVIELTDAGEWKKVASSGTPTQASTTLARIQCESVLDSGDGYDFVDFAINPDTGRVLGLYTFWDSSLTTQYLRVKHFNLSPTGITPVNSAAGDTLATANSSRTADQWMARLVYNEAEDQFYVCYAGSTANDLKACIIVENGEDDLTLGAEASVLTADLDSIGSSIYLYYDTRQSVMVLVYGRTTSRFISAKTLRNVSSTTITQGTENNMVGRDVSYQNWMCAYDPVNEIYCIIFNGGTYAYMRSFYASAVDTITLGSQVLFGTTGGSHQNYMWIGYHETDAKFVACVSNSTGDWKTRSRASTSTATDVNSWSAEHADTFWTLTQSPPNTGNYYNPILDKLICSIGGNQRPVEDTGTDQYELQTGLGLAPYYSSIQSSFYKWFSEEFGCFFCFESGGADYAGAAVLTFYAPVTNAENAIAISADTVSDDEACSGVLIGLDANQSGMTPGAWQWPHNDGYLVDWDTGFPRIGYALTATTLLVMKETI